ncbi:ABC transporter substrate-binding protein [Pseudonocardia sp. CA-107938]|uniref:ABC transporter substrate-binding protein n=1 Tax=Pseudonocardia sp. CA-107938 TaxID=3240021 RepID=UPI003D94D23F
MIARFKVKQAAGSDLSRRGFLLGASALGLGVAVAACAPGNGGQLGIPGPTAFPAALPGGTPKRGGTLTVGVTGSGNAETLYPGGAQVYSDYFRCYALYDLLFYPGKNVTPIVPGLAVSAESNADATQWTIKLRDGVVWHDGKPFTAADVVYNIQTLWTDSKINLGASYLDGLIDLPNVKAVDPLTVQVPLTRPVAEFPTLLVYVNFPVLPAGATPESVAAKPIGTGAFRYVSFTPGRESVFEANRDYWEEGKPYVDRLVINSSFTDKTALVNALVGGQVNVLPAVDPLAARQQGTDPQFQVIQSELAANIPMITMRVDEGPFADNRVRQAFRLACDRQGLVNGALAGFGTPANDLISIGSQYFASDMIRTHDPDRARSLFQEAGVAGKSFSLQTWAGGGIWDSAATLFAQQVEAAGVKVDLNVTSGETYFTPAGGVYTGYFRQNVTGPIGVSLTASYRLFLSKTAPFPDTHWAQQPGGDEYEALLNKAISTKDPAQAEALWRQVQQLQFDQGGVIAWAAMPYVDAAANNVRGLSTGAAMSFDNFRMQDGWIE